MRYSSDFSHLYQIYIRLQCKDFSYFMAEKFFIRLILVQFKINYTLITTINVRKELRMTGTLFIYYS